MLYKNTVIRVWLKVMRNLIAHVRGVESGSWSAVPAVGTAVLPTPSFLYSIW
jgi:hypothetical protein